MKFKVERKAKSYYRLKILMKKIMDARNASIQFKEEHFPECTGVCGLNSVAAGGISAFQFSSKPEGFKSVGRNHQKLFFPKARGNKELIEKIGALPIVSMQEMHNVIGYEEDWSGGRVALNYGLQYVEAEDVFILNVTGKQPNLKDDLIEILESEYIRLSEVDIT